MEFHDPFRICYHTASNLLTTAGSIERAWPVFPMFDQRTRIDRVCDELANRELKSDATKKRRDAHARDLLVTIAENIPPAIICDRRCTLDLQRLIEEAGINIVQIIRVPRPAWLDLCVSLLHWNSMVLGDSVWFPHSVRRARILSVVIVMVILHQSELLGLMDAGLLFGWLPVQIAYDISFLLVGVLILYWIAMIVPATPDEYGPSSQAEGSTTTESPPTTEK